MRKDVGAIAKGLKGYDRHAQSCQVSIKVASPDYKH